ncbi:HIT family protein [Nanoarchaeota archaeon]
MTECEICKQIENKENILYEDETTVAILSNKSMPGHIEVVTKKHIISIDELEDDDVVNLFYLASYAATAVFEFLQAHGTNIVSNQGRFTGNHFTIDVFPRFQEDGFNFMWEPQKLEENLIKEPIAKIIDKLPIAGAATESAPKEAVEQKTDVIKEKSDKVNYLLKQLRRIP